MEFSLINKEELTEKIIEKIKRFNFKHVGFDKRVNLTFVSINDRKFNSYITKIFFEDKLQHCLHIYKRFEYVISLDIPLRIIESVDTL